MSSIVVIAFFDLTVLATVWPSCSSSAFATAYPGLLEDREIFVACCSNAVSECGGGHLTLTQGDLVSQ